LFFECDYVKEFWKRVAWLIFSAYYKLFTFEVVNVLFLTWDSGSKEMDDRLKLLTLCGEFHLHKCKVTESKPNFKLFCVDLKLFYDSLCLSAKAAKTTLLLKKNMVSL